MRRIAMLAAGWAVALAAIAGADDERAVIGNGRIREEKRSVATFRRIEVGSVVEAEVSAGPEPSVAVIAEDNLVPLVTTEVRDGSLVIELDGNRPMEVDGRVRIARNHPIRVVVVVPDLQQLVVRNAAVARVEAAGFSAFSLRVRSAGQAKLYHLKAAALDVDATDAGIAELHGEAGKATLASSKASQILGSDATFRTADVRLGPGGITQIRVTDAIAGTIRTGLLIVEGEPRSRKVQAVEGGQVSYPATPK